MFCLQTNTGHSQAKIKKKTEYPFCSLSVLSTFSRVHKKESGRSTYSTSLRVQERVISRWKKWEARRVETKQASAVINLVTLGTLGNTSFSAKSLPRIRLTPKTGSSHQHALDQTLAQNPSVFGVLAHVKCSAQFSTLTNLTHNTIGQKTAKSHCALWNVWHKCLAA